MHWGSVGLGCLQKIVVFLEYSGLAGKSLKQHTCENLLILSKISHCKYQPHPTARNIRTWQKQPLLMWVTGSMKGSQCLLEDGIGLCCQLSQSLQDILARSCFFFPNCFLFTSSSINFGTSEYWVFNHTVFFAGVACIS